MYKILSKLLASRLKSVLGSPILPFQSDYIIGKLMLDGVLVANEVVEFSTRSRKIHLLFKVDFEKAYCKVSWNFLRYMLKRMGFGVEWFKWMEAIVFSSQMLVLVNGSPTFEFEKER